MIEPVCPSTSRRSKIVTRGSVALLVGAMAPQLISFPAGSDRLPTILVAFLLLLPFVSKRDVAFATAGLGLFLLHAGYVAGSRLDPGYAGDSMLVDVRIADFPRQRDAVATFDATAVDDDRVRGQLRLSWFEPPVALAMGDVWRLELRLGRPRGNANPGAPDSEAWLFRERVAATGYVVAGRHNLLVDSRTLRGIDALRQRYVARVQQHVGDRDVAGVLAAIVVGARHGISREQWERYARTGTAHLMAISGLHVGLAAGGAFLLASSAGGLGGQGRHQYRRALAIALATALAYVMLSGLAVPARRAGLMLAVATLSLLSRRQPSPTRVLGAALAVLVLSDPLSTMTPGFKLSFAAVGLLVWQAQQRRRQVSTGFVVVLRGLCELTRLQLILLTGLLPLTILIFARSSPAAPLVNIVAVPLFSIVTVPLALLSFVLDGPLDAVGRVCMHAAATTAAWIERLIVVVAQFRFASVPAALPSGHAWLLLALPPLWALLPPRWPGRSLAWLGALALLLWRPPAPPPNCADIETLDVGQGLAVVVRTHGHALLYDSGPAYRSGATAAERILLPYFRGLGVRRIDRLVISHADLDHAGGLAAIIDALQPASVTSGELPLPGDVVAARCAAGQRWRWDGVEFHVLHPPPGGNASGNDTSCVLLVAAGRRRFLLTGDIEAATEAMLVQQRVLPQVDVLTVPHHGSRTSSTRPFTIALAPRLAIVSAAGGNQWGFPKPDVVARWRDAGADVLNTASSGAIRVRLCAYREAPSVREYRRARRRVWHDAP